MRKRQQPLTLVGGNGKQTGTDKAARRASRFVNNAEHPTIYFRRDQEEGFNVRSGDSPHRGKNNTTESYWEETQAAMTNDGSKVAWASNWGQNVGQDKVFLMRLDMPPNWKK